jgi:hypothetical protein
MWGFGDTQEKRVYLGSSVEPYVYQSVGMLKRVYNQG